MTDIQELAHRRGSVLTLSGIDQVYGATHAVRDLTLTLEAGTVHALVGENGAGKSTAAQIAAGVVSPTRGTVLVDGEPRSYGSARQAEVDGVVLIPQELLLYDSLTVQENLFAGRARPRTRLKTVDGSELGAVAGAALDRLGLSVGRRDRVGSLAPGVKQMVAIARALVNEARVLVMDEPTAALDEWEAQRLLTVVDGLRRDGVAILYVSHRLHEVMSISDTITVLRDGAQVVSGPASGFDQDTLVAHMLGREMLAREPRAASSTPEIRLATRHLSRDGEFEDISIEVRRGEVVGMAGIVGAGRSDFGQTIFGMKKPSRGEIEVEGELVAPSQARAAIAAGIAYLPEERQSQGLFMGFSVEDNVCVPSLPRLARRGFVTPGRVRGLASRALRGLGLRGGLDDSVDSLSGGNQQKVLLAKWLATEPRVMILDEPTRGIDVGARSEIYAIIDELSRSGCAIVLISSDLQELLLMSDRIVVVRSGRMVAEFDRDTMTEDAVGRAALGVVPGTRPSHDADRVTM